MFFKRKKAQEPILTKYKSVESRLFSILRDRDGKPPMSNMTLYRIVALRDIPLHGVKVGDLGGWISFYANLSQEGDCWVGKDAIVAGNIKITGNALVTDNALVVSFHTQEILVSDDAIIRGNARVTNDDTYPYDCSPTLINRNALVEGDTKLTNVSIITDNAIISDYADLKRNVMVSGDAKVYGKTSLGDMCNISGTSLIFGDTTVQRNSNIRGASIIGNNSSNNLNSVLITAGSEIISKIIKEYGRAMDNDMVPLHKEPPSRPAPIIVAPAPIVEIETTESNLSNAKGILVDIEKDIASYQNDIVKLIKYPTMLDRSVQESLEMFIALKACKRIDEETHAQQFINAVFELEKKHMIAESKAKKVAGSLLTLEEKKRATTATNLIDMAMNDASTDNEKRAAVKQSLKQLEGVIPLADVTINALYKSVGLLQIEASQTV